MPPRPNITVGKPLPINNSYVDDKMARRFWRLSFQAGRQYAMGKDARGHEMLIKHEREEADSFKRRQRITKVRNHCGPIIRKYNDFVFRRPAERPEKKPEYLDLVDDIDGMGTPLPNLIRHACRMAQIERESYLVCDSTAPSDDAVRSVAQAKDAGIRPILRLISPDSLLWWVDKQGVLTECLVLFDQDDGTAFVNWYTPTTITRIELDVVERPDNEVEYKIKSIGSPKSHSAGACPVVRLRPLFDQNDDFNPGESQIAPLAELQQSIWNITSLLYEEIYNVTFTQAILSGVSADQFKDVKTGSQRFICLPNAESKWTMIGADAKQAETIQTAIMNEQRELYRIAGMASQDPLQAKGQQESGAAKAFKFNDLAANLSALADACEQAENEAMTRLAAMNGMGEWQDSRYPDDFQMPELEAEIDTLVAVLTVPQIPVVFKRSIASRFADRNLSLTDAELEEGLDQIGEDAENSGKRIPFPGTASDDGSSRDFDASRNPLNNPNDDGVSRMAVAAS
jgi:hypothetical protein